MQFKHYDSLSVFTQVARYGSFSAAAEPLNRTKGAVSHQIRLLESALGFTLFHRQPRGVVLTEKGATLLSACAANFKEIDDVIKSLRVADAPQLTLGVTTYFSSRWLSQRLMHYMQQHSEVRLRLQPMIDFTDLEGEGIDLAIRWGNGHWEDTNSQLLFSCPAWPSGNKDTLHLVQELGLKKAFKGFTLLHDRHLSSAWKQWFEVAGIDYVETTDKLILPDPNVRVEAVINSQGVALNDSLVQRELDDKRLYRLSDIELADYGYYIVYSSSATLNPVAEEFAHWLMKMAK